MPPEDQQVEETEEQEEEDAFSAWERKWGSDVEELDKELEEVEEEEPAAEDEKKKAEDEEDRKKIRAELDALRTETARANAAAKRLQEQREIDRANEEFRQMAAEDPVLAQLAASAPPKTDGTKQEFMQSAKSLRAMAETLKADREKVREEARLEERRKLQARVGGPIVDELPSQGSKDPQLKEKLDSGDFDGYLEKQAEGFMGYRPPED